VKWVRSVLAGIVGVIAVVALLASVVGVWARFTVFDAGKVGNSVEAALDAPGVTDALAVRLADGVVTAVNLEGFVEQILPDFLDQFGPAITGGATQLLQRQLSSLLADPERRSLLATAFERAYSRFLDVLRGDGLVDGITVHDADVVVNFLPLIADGLRFLQRFGLNADATIPDLQRQDDPAPQIAELEQALGRDLPDDFGQVVVYSSASVGSVSATVDQAQRLLVLLKRALVLILIVAVVASIGAVLLARNRRRAIMILLLSSAAVFVVARALVNKILDDLPSAARRPAGQAAIEAASTTLMRGLVALLGVGALLFLLAATVMYLVGPNSALRRRLGAPTEPTSITNAIAAHRALVSLAAFGSALLVITLAGFGLLSLVIALVLAGFGVYALLVPGEPAAVVADSATTTQEPGAPT
jgi:hypothetical protein